MVGHPRCVFINYIGLINCRTQLICGRYMFITSVSTTCFSAYGHLQVDELTKTHKQLYFIRLRGVGGLLDGGTRSRVYWVGRGGCIWVCIMLT
jgi:hypothetical protein